MDEIVATKGPKRSTHESFDPEDGSPVYWDDGVDLTLVRWMLSLTPTQRLQILQQHVRSVIRLRNERTAS